jgi:hypothetical protein
MLKRTTSCFVVGQNPTRGVFYGVFTLLENNAAKLVEWYLCRDADLPTILPNGSIVLPPIRISSLNDILSDTIQDQLCRWGLIVSGSFRLIWVLHARPMCHALTMHSDKINIFADDKLSCSNPSIH